MAKPLVDLQQSCNQGPCVEVPRVLPGRTTSNAVVLGWYSSPWQQVLLLLLWSKAIYMGDFWTIVHMHSSWKSSNLELFFIVIHHDDMWCVEIMVTPPGGWTLSEYMSETKMDVMVAQNIPQGPAYSWTFKHISRPSSADGVSCVIIEIAQSSACDWSVELWWSWIDS